MLLVCEKIFVALTTVFINDQCLCTEAGLSQDATANVGGLERLHFLKISLICILWSSHETWTFNGDIKNKKDVCVGWLKHRLCAFVILCGGRWVGEWLDTVIPLSTDFSWFPPNQPLGKKLTSSHCPGLQGRKHHAETFSHQISYSWESRLPVMWKGEISSNPWCLITLSMPVKDSH